MPDPKRRLDRRGPPASPGKEAPKATSSSADYGKTASFLAVGVGLTGIITYAYFLIASHTLSKPDYGQITLLWSAVFITISTLYRPIEQLLSRHISERLTRGEPINQPMRVASTIQFGLALLFVALALALRGPIEGDLFDGSETIYWVFFSSVLFYAASYFARGFLAGSQRFGLFVALILSESCFRTVFAVLVAVDVLSGQSAVAIGITAAPALSLLVVPFAFARRAKREGAAPRPDPVEGEGGELSFRSGAGFAGAVLVIMFSEQALINAGPLITGALKGSAEVGYIFNVLMLARAPLQLFQSVSTSILPHLTSLHASKEPGSDREFSRTIRMVLIGIVAFTALVLAVVLVAGPKCMQIAFGKSFTYDRLGLVLATLGMGLYLASVTINQACTAQGKVRRAAARWIACSLGFIAWNFVPIVGDQFRRVEIGFLLSAAILFALLLWVYEDPRARRGDAPSPGSTEELEARLAIIDDGV